MRLGLIAALELELDREEGMEGAGVGRYVRDGGGCFAPCRAV